MKGLLVRGTCTVDADSGSEEGIYRIIIPERDGLLVTYTNGRAHASRGADHSRNAIVGKIEVPDALVAKIEAFLDAQRALEEAEPDFRDFLPATRTVKFKRGDRCRIVKLDDFQPRDELRVGMVVEITRAPSETISGAERWTPQGENEYGLTMPPRLVKFVGGRKEMVAHSYSVREDELELLAPAT